VRKKLWMKIAKYLFNYQGKNKNKNQGKSPLFGDASFGHQYSIKEAIEMVTSNQRLKIDDLLPLFPPEEKVSDMKE